MNIESLSEAIDQKRYYRPSGRAYDELRKISFELNIAPNAAGSVLVKFGNTQVICSATVENKVPSWMIQQGVSGGWLTAEYSMLPYSTLDRKARASSTGKQDGRTMEIQRLIGRALRGVINLQKMPGMTLWVDCDVLQADGGTRTASISGAYVAAKMAFMKLMSKNLLKQDPLVDSVGAVSVGVVKDTSILDLDYVEDVNASVDANLVMTGSGKFIELQSAGEESTFSEVQLNEMIDLGKLGITKITQLQKQVIQGIIL